MSGVFSSPSRETKNQLNWPYMFSGDASHFVFVDVAAPSPLFIIVPNWLLSTRSCLGGRQDKNQLLGSHYMATPSNNNQVYLVFRYISGSPRISLFKQTHSMLLKPSSSNIQPRRYAIVSQRFPPCSSFHSLLYYSLVHPFFRQIQIWFRRSSSSSIKVELHATLKRWGVPFVSLLISCRQLTQHQRTP